MMHRNIYINFRARLPPADALAVTGCCSFSSATWPKEIRELAHEFLSDPVRVTIGSEDLTASDSIKQIVEVIDMKDKDKRYVNRGVAWILCGSANAVQNGVETLPPATLTMRNLFQACATDAKVPQERQPRAGVCAVQERGAADRAAPQGQGLQGRRCAWRHEPI